MPRNRILDKVSLYWLTRCGTSSARNYYESHNSPDPELRVDVPSAITMYLDDAEKASRTWAQKRYRQLVQWRAPTMAAGGTRVFRQGSTRRPGCNTSTKR